MLDDIIVWWVDEERFDVMPNASNTSRVVGALGAGEDVTATRAIIAKTTRKMTPHANGTGWSTSTAASTSASMCARSSPVGVSR